MARKLDDDPSHDRSRDPTVSHARDGLLGRRTYLKTGVATAVAGSGFLGVASGLSGASNNPVQMTTLNGDDRYRVVRLDENEQRQYEISDGENFEHVLIDQSAEGAMFSLAVAEGANDWSIQNVGWKGRAPSEDRDFTFLIHVRGHGQIENVFIDQRNHDGDTEGSDVGGIWTYSDSHHGHVDCRHNFIAGCGNNGCYVSGDGWDHNEATGTVSHFRSYHRDNTVSNFRPGRPGSTIRECVSVAHDPDGRRGSYPTSDGKTCRAIWAWHNPDITMEDCAIWHDPTDYAVAPPFWATHRSGDKRSDGEYCELSVINCDINASWTEAGNDLIGHGGTDRRRVEFEGLGTSPTVAVLGDGVPLTAEMAAAGGRELPPDLGTAPSGGHGRSRRGGILA